MLDFYDQPNEIKQVQIVHVLDSGQKIIDHKIFEKEFKHLFNIDDQKIINERWRLSSLTDSWKKSILYIKTNGDFYSKVNVHRYKQP
jgi:hypothetical protein